MRGLYLHTPKTGGKSTLKIIDQYPDIHYIWVNDININIANDTGELIDVPLEDVRNSFAWSFVRNPFDRLISVWSAWRFRQNKTLEDIITLCKIGESCNWILPTVPFSMSITSEYHRTDISIMYHLRPMHIAITKLFKFCNPYIAKFENLYGEWGFIKQQLGITDNLPYINKSKHKDYRNYLSNPKYIDNITRIYKIDFEMFDYHTDITK
jgi:hypothetical protein